MKKNIVLIGPRGAGKSKAAKNLSFLCGYPILSTDLLFSYENNGISIADYLQKNKHDWRAFREVEYAILQKATQLSQVIIDCGGGMVVDLAKDGSEVLSKRKIELMQDNALVVYLKADLDYLAQKVGEDPNRPKLSKKDSFQKIMRERHPIYKKAADLVIDTTGKKGKELGLTLYCALQQRGFFG